MLFKQAASPHIQTLSQITSRIKGNADLIYGNISTTEMNMSNKIQEADDVTYYISQKVGIISKEIFERLFNNLL